MQVKIIEVPSRLDCARAGSSWLPVRCGMRAAVDYWHPDGLSWEEAGELPGHESAAKWPVAWE